MNARELMLRRRRPLRLVIFDCDGVIVDSEPVSNRLLAEDLTRRGWPMTTEEATRLFVGISLPTIEGRIASRLGHKLPESWGDDMMRRIVTAMAEEAAPMPGGVEALHAVTALGLPWRIASNSSHEEMRAKFGRLGISSIVQGRVHSFADVARGKPAPDLFLAAAQVEGVTPDECVVIEDSVAGVAAAVAAGMDCLGFDRHGDGAALRATGATPFHDMRDIPDLIALARGAPAETPA